MSSKGEIIIDSKRNIVYQVKDIKGTLAIIERVIPSPHEVTELDLLEPSFGCNGSGLISMVLAMD